MTKQHIAFIVGMLVFAITTYLLVMVPIVVKHDMDLIGKITFIVMIALGYFTAFLMFYVESQWKDKKD